LGVFPRLAPVGCCLSPASRAARLKRDGSASFLGRNKPNSRSLGRAALRRSVGMTISPYVRLSLIAVDEFEFDTGDRNQVAG